MGGDIYVRIMIEPHKVFTRRGADLYIEKKISLLEALTGLTMEIKQLDGTILKIATAPGDVISHGKHKIRLNKKNYFIKNKSRL
jgi:DnaJ family protein A protein 2